MAMDTGLYSQAVMIRQTYLGNSKEKLKTKNITSKGSP